MPKTKKKSRTLPERPPKRTGKRGVGPLDTETAKPRQGRLPEMDDPQIEELEAKAEEYVSIRDQRIALTPHEKRLKDDLLALMKANSKETYNRDGIEIRIIHESESVKVRVKKTDDED